MLTVSQALEQAVQHHRAGALDTAEKIYRAVLRIEPQHAGVRFNLGNVLQKANRIGEAIESYCVAAELSPEDSTVHRVLGTAYKAQGNLGAAIASFRKALALRPDYAEAQNNLGNTYLELRDFESAIAAFRTAAKLRPDSADFHFNLGNALHRAGELEKAELEMRLAVEINSLDPNLHNSLGIVLFDLGNADDAIACYERAIELDSHHVRAHYNRSLAWLWSGNWERGWQEYEWRHRLPGHHAVDSDGQRWDGSVQQQATLLVETEQGLGDTIQFARFLAAARSCVQRIVVRAGSAMHALLRRIDGVDEVVDDNSPLPSHDLRIALMSLPHVLGIASPPHRYEPYISADSSRRAYWRNLLAGLEGYRIGIQWQGNPNQPNDVWRSFPLREFQPIAELPGVRLCSLQKGTGIEQLRGVEFPVLDFGSRLDESDAAFLETAALMQNLDLVITADTSVAHLAGALGVPVWILLSSVPEWRWNQSGERTPWYPTARLFRQTVRGNWTQAFTNVCNELMIELTRKVESTFEEVR